MDTSAWSFQPDDEEIRTMVREYIVAFDPARGMPATLSLGGPEDDLIAAAVPAEWQKQKDAIFAGMDAYAVKGTRYRHCGPRSPTEPVRCAAGCPPSRRPTTVVVGEHDHPLVEQAPELAAEVADGRLTVIEGAYHSPQLTHPDEWRAAVEAHLGGPPRNGRRRDGRPGLAAAGQRPHRAGRLRRLHPAAWRRHVGLG